MSGPGVGHQVKAVGVVRPGALADLLLVDGDPTDDITLLEDAKNLVVIMKDGKLLKNESAAQRL